MHRIECMVDAERHARAAHEPMKACRACSVAKPLTSFARDGRTKDGWRHRCGDCARLEKIAELREANAKLTALVSVEALLAGSL